MQISDLRTLIRECIQEAFGEEGWMQAVNVRETADEQTKLLGGLGSTTFFGEMNSPVISIHNGTGVDMNVTAQRRGNNYYLQIKNKNL